MDDTSNVDQIRVTPIALCDGIFLPFAERLGGGTRQVTVTGTPSAARSRTSGNIIIWVDVPGQIGDGKAHDLGFLLEELDPFAGLSQSADSSESADFPPALMPSSRLAIFSQRCGQPSEIPKSFAIGRSGASRLQATAMTSRRN